MLVSNVAHTLHSYAVDLYLEKCTDILFYSILYFMTNSFLNLFFIAIHFLTCSVKNTCSFPSLLKNIKILKLVLTFFY
jgi:hypothetical protein